MKSCLIVALLAATPYFSGCATPRGPMDDLRDVVESGDTDRVLAIASATPQVKTYYGTTVASLDLALYVAARVGDVGLMKVLVEKGANPLVPDILDIAVRSDKTQSVAYLLSKGANPRSSMIWGGTPGTPYQAARAGKHESVLALLDAATTRPSAPEQPVQTAMAQPAIGNPTVSGSDIDSPAGHGADRPNDYALIVGIEDYQSVPKAEYGVRDAKTVRKHLEALGFPARNIISLEGSQATGSKLRSYLEEWLPLNVKAESTLFVYYSGHGAPDAKTGDAYLVPWDGDPKFLKSTALPLRQFYADLAKTKAKRVIVALDACFSGAGGRSVLAQGARPLVAKVADLAPAGGKITVLAAASGDEITGTLQEQSHGLFTYYLLKALAANPRASAQALFDDLNPRVQDDARRDNRSQTPVLSGAAPGPLLP